MGIFLRLESLYNTSEKYNTNLMVPHRKVVKMISIVCKFDQTQLPEYTEEFETKFCEYLVSICKKTRYLREIIKDDIVVYDIVTKKVQEEVTEPEIDEEEQSEVDEGRKMKRRFKGNYDIIEGIADFFEAKNYFREEEEEVPVIRYVTKTVIERMEMKISQVATIEEFEDFEFDLISKFREKYGQEFSLERKTLSAFFNLKLDDLGNSNIKYMDRKKEKLIRKGKWAYYLPGGWILYELDSKKIPDDVKENWLPVYHPIGGFNFKNYGNLSMCDDCGPNRYIKALTNHPLDQGLFVTPRIKYIMGNI